MNAEIDISNVILRTSRLTLRPWRQSDLDDFFEYASVEGVGEMAGWPHHKAKADTQAILDMFIAGRKTFAIEHEGKVIGSLGVEKYDERLLPNLSDKKGRELGFVLSKAYWGRGLTPEAVSEVISWLFDEQGLDFIVCRHFADNPQSKRVQQKCGFKFIKYSKYKTANNEVKTDCVNLLLKDENKQKSEEA